MRTKILATLFLLNITFSFAQEKYVFEKPEFKIKINLSQPFKVDDFTNQNQSGFFGQTNESLFSADVCNEPECWYIEVTKGYENFTVFSNIVEEIKKNSSENLKNYIVKKDNNLYEIVLNQYGLMYTKVFKYNGNTVLVYMRCYQCNDDLELIKKTFNERFINE